MLGIPNPYAILGGLVLGLAALGGAFAFGDSVGANRVIARDARTFQHAQDAMRHATAKLNGVQDRLANAETGRRETVREIYREVPTLIDRPVYRTVCSDDDGVHLLERARAAANGNGGPDIAPQANGSPGNPAQH